MHDIVLLTPKGPLVQDQQGVALRITVEHSVFISAQERVHFSGKDAPA